MRGSVTRQCGKPVIEGGNIHDLGTRESAVVSYRLADVDLIPSFVPHHSALTETPSREYNSDKFARTRQFASLPQVHASMQEFTLREVTQRLSRISQVLLAEFWRFQDVVHRAVVVLNQAAADLDDDLFLYCCLTMKEVYSRLNLPSRGECANCSVFESPRRSHRGRIEEWSDTSTRTRS
jgi:hypothetical protein